MRSAGTTCSARSANSETNLPVPCTPDCDRRPAGAIDEAEVDGVKHGATPARVNKVRVPQADRLAALGCLKIGNPPRSNSRIEDPNGEGPRIWFQVVPREEVDQERIHIDVNASGGRDVSLDTRRERVEAEAAQLVSLGATRLHTNVEEALDHYAVALTDPEGNEFDIN